MTICPELSRMCPRRFHWSVLAGRWHDGERFCLQDGAGHGDHDYGDDGDDERGRDDGRPPPPRPGRHDGRDCARDAPTDDASG